MKDLIESTGELLRASDLGRLNAIVAAWNDIEWKEIKSETGQDAAVNVSSPKVINLFPGLRRMHQRQQQAAVLREFGISLFTRMGTEAAHKRWEMKLTLPESAHIDAVQDKLKDESLPTYKAIMESFDPLMDRYVSLNITNALQANGVHRKDAFNVNIRQYGCTLEYANCRKMHSLVPYVTAYGPREVASCPGRGLAEKIVFQMGHILESSLAQAYGRMIIEVFTLCRKG